MDDHRRRDGRQGPALGEVMGYGLTWAAATLLFLMLGSFADRWLGTKPALTLIGAFVGAGAGFYYMYHHLVVAPKQRDSEDKERRP